MSPLPPEFAVDHPYESNPSDTALGHTTATELALYDALALQAREVHGRIGRPVSVLDVCAASGGAAWHIAPSIPISTLVLVDIDPTMCEAAKQRQWPVQDVQVHLADSVDWQDTRLFDIILANSAYHHIEDDRKERFLRNLVEQLAEGGRILIGEHLLPDYADGDMESYRQSVRAFYLQRLRALRDANDDPRAIDIIRQTARYCWERRYEYQVSRRIFEQHVASARCAIAADTRIWPERLGQLPDGSGSYAISMCRDREIHPHITQHP